MRFLKYNNSVDFLADVSEALMHHELQNNLIFLNAALTENADTVFMSVKSNGGDILAVGAQTGPYPIVIYENRNMTCKEAVRTLVKGLDKIGRSVPGVMGLPETVEAYARELSPGTYISKIHDYNFRECHAYVRPKHQEGVFRVCTEYDLAYLGKWLRDASELLNDDDKVDNSLEANEAVARHNVEKREAFVWTINDVPVSLVTKIRRTSEQGSVIGLVYSPKEFEGKGYATQCVAEFLRREFDLGRKYVGLFTRKDNLAANHVYEKLGFNKITHFRRVSFR